MGSSTSGFPSPEAEKKGMIEVSRDFAI